GAGGDERIPRRVRTRRARQHRRGLLRHDAGARQADLRGSRGGGAARGAGAAARHPVQRARDLRDHPRLQLHADRRAHERHRLRPLPPPRGGARPPRRHRRLVEGGDFQAATDVALEQVRGGANLLDVNMDADLLDGERAMTTFLNLLATEPEAARLPFVIDSSRWSVLEAGLKCVQGKGVVNSLSLKEGEEPFLEQARRVRRYGAGVVVMAFDEEGQAETVERKVAICE